MSDDTAIPLDEAPRTKDGSIDFRKLVEAGNSSCAGNRDTRWLHQCSIR